MTASARHYALLFIAACLVGAGFSFVLAFLTMEMERQSLSGTLIGLTHSFGIGSIILVAHWVAEGVRRLGPVRSFMLCVAVLAISLFAHALVAPYLPLMLLCRFVMGVANAALFATVESWLNAITPDKARGRVLSLYCGILLLGFTFGSALLQFWPAEGAEPYLLAAGLFAAAVPFVLLARGVSIQLPREDGFRFRDVFFLAPALMVTAAVFGFSETVMLSLLPLMGIRTGLAEGQAQALLTALLAGGVVMQPLIGWLADRISRYHLLAGLLAVACAGSALLPYTLRAEGLAQPALMALWGVGVLSIYTVLIAAIGVQFQDKSLAHAATAVIAMYGFGSAFGPFSAGLVLDAYGEAGFRWLLVALFGGALGVVFRAALAHNRRL